MDKIRYLFAISLAASISTYATAATSIVQDHVLVTSAYGGGYGRPANYEASYSLQLGLGSWPFPYVDIHFDNAAGRTSYANMLATASYLSYIHDLTVFTVKPGDEISQATLSNASFKSLFTTGGWDRPADWGNRAISSTGFIRDIYLGFSVKIADQYPQYKNYPDNSNNLQHFGWVHLQYTQANGLRMVGSAMTLDGAGIYANSLTSIPSVDETSSSLLAGAGLLGLLAFKARRKNRIGQA